MPGSGKIVRIIGVPMDLGQSRRGVDMGPSAVRYADLQGALSHLGYEVHDCGNISVPVAEAISEHERPQPNARHLDAVVQVCEAVYRTTEQHVKPGELAVFLGGDHSMSAGSIAAMCARGRIGVVWVDAHGDYNTPETSPSGNVHGMPMAALLGHGPQALADIGYPGPKLRPDQVVMIGIRDLDSLERTNLRQSGLAVFTMSDIDDRGIGAVTRAALEKLSGFDALHISFDLDSLDPEFAPGVGTPVPGGLSYREAHLIMELFAETRKVRSLDIVEINPILDTRNRTAQNAVELATSLFGKRIL